MSIVANISACKHTCPKLEPKDYMCAFQASKRKKSHGSSTMCVAKSQRSIRPGCSLILNVLVELSGLAHKAPEGSARHGLLEPPGMTEDLTSPQLQAQWLWTSLRGLGLGYRATTSIGYVLWFSNESKGQFRCSLELCIQIAIDPWLCA